MTNERFLIEYDDRQTGWHTMEGPTHTDARLVANEVAETLDQLGQFSPSRMGGITSIRVTFIADSPIDVTREIADAVLALRPHLSVMDALSSYTREAA